VPAKTTGDVVWIFLVIILAASVSCAPVPVQIELEAEETLDPCHAPTFNDDNFVNSSSPEYACI
jgi:hypothetical protein